MAGRGKKGRSSAPSAGARPLDPVAHRHAELVVAGMQAFDAGDVEAAKRNFRAVLNENIEHPEALLGMGLVARHLNQLDTAGELIRRSIKGNPRSAVAWSNLGNIYQDQGRWEEAVDAHRQAVRLNPHHPKIRQNFGSILNLVDRPYEALPHLREAVRLDPKSVDALANFATVLNRAGEYGASVKYFRRAIELNPAHAIANYNFAVCLNSQGRWEEGWPLYEWRFLAPSMASQMPRMQMTHGLPDSLDGMRVFISGEQGIGDEIRFATMIPDLVERGAQVTLRCAEKLRPLFERSFPAVRIVTSLDAVVGDRASDYDVVLPAGNLGRHLRGAKDRFPRHSGLLVPDPDKVAAWRARLNALGSGLKVGICWRSSLRGRLRNENYAQVEELAPLLKTRGVTFVNLQYDDCAEELARVQAATGVTVHTFDDIDLFDDLDGSAALTAATDMVVSAGTAVVTIAGGLGVPAVEFRSRPIPPDLPIDGCDPWFPSVKLVGKRISASWEATMKLIRELLEERVAGRSL